MYFNNKKQIVKKFSGFTALELLIVISILAIITISVIGSLSSYRKEQSLRAQMLNVVSLINESRSKTLSSLDFSSYGVRVQQDSLISFKGDSFSTNDPYNIVYNLPDGIYIENISIVGGNNIFFKKLTGETQNTGSFDISIGSKKRTVTILKNGQLILSQ